uniref:Uncharacterized protein n=1 Tax=Anguilla anguilla TaxID=7936 RepID=A0A0E9VBZ9_ANGAN
MWSANHTVIRTESFKPPSKPEPLGREVTQVTSSNDSLAKFSLASAFGNGFFSIGLTLFNADEVLLKVSTCIHF